MKSFAATGNPGTPRISRFPAEYQAGVCNIGPEEIAARRRAGHVGLAATVLMFAGLVLVGAPPVARLVLFVPAAVAASGYLQAWLKFCAAFGSRGIFNFGPMGATTSVSDDASRARDRRKALQIGLASGLIGLAVAVMAVFLPI